VRRGHTRHQVTEPACSVSVRSNRNQANPARTMLHGSQIDDDSIVGLLLQRWQIVVVGIRLVTGCTAASSAVGFLLGGRQLGLCLLLHSGADVESTSIGRGMESACERGQGAGPTSTSRRARLGRFTCHCCSRCLQPSSGDLSSVTLFE